MGFLLWLPIQGLRLSRKDTYSFGFLGMVFSHPLQRWLPSSSFSNQEDLAQYTLPGHWTGPTPCPEGRKPNQDHSLPQPPTTGCPHALIRKQTPGAASLMSGPASGLWWADSCWEVSWLPAFDWREASVSLNCTFYGLGAIFLGFHTQLAGDQPC